MKLSLGATVTINATSSVGPPAFINTLMVQVCVKVPYCYFVGMRIDGFREDLNRKLWWFLVSKERRKKRG